MRRIFAASIFALTLASSWATADDTPCDMESSQCREKFVNDNLPSPHQPDLNDPHDAELNQDINDKLVTAENFEKMKIPIMSRIDDERQVPKDESVDEENERLKRLTEDRNELKTIQTEKAQAYQDAIDKTIDLYRLRPQVTTQQLPRDVPYLQPASPWLPTYSENELPGHRLTTEENRRLWEERGIIYSGKDVPPAIGGGTTLDDARIFIFHGAITSPKGIASVIYHETVHWLDHNALGRTPNPAEDYASEVRAYQKQIDAKDIFGYSQNDVDTLRKIRNSYGERISDASISWGEERAKHPLESLYGAALSEPSQNELENPEPIRDSGDNSFFQGLKHAGQVSQEDRDTYAAQNAAREAEEKLSPEYLAYRADQDAQSAERSKYAEMEIAEQRRYQEHFYDMIRRTDYLVQMVGLACSDPDSLEYAARQDKVPGVGISDLDLSWELDRTDTNACQNYILRGIIHSRGPISGKDLLAWAREYRRAHPSQLVRFTTEIGDMFRAMGKAFGDPSPSSGGRNDSGGGGRGSGSDHSQHAPNVMGTPSAGQVIGIASGGWR